MFYHNYVYGRPYRIRNLSSSAGRTKSRFIKNLSIVFVSACRLLEKKDRRKSPNDFLYNISCLFQLKMRGW